MEKKVNLSKKEDPEVSDPKGKKSWSEEDYKKF